MADAGTVVSTWTGKPAARDDSLTDSLQSYDGLEQDFLHHVSNHAKEFPRDAVHTNGLENFWSLLKPSFPLVL